MSRSEVAKEMEPNQSGALVMTSEANNVLNSHHHGGREYRKGNWTLNETMVLIAAKKLDDERRVKGGDREKSKTAELRWKWIENYCWKSGCYRSHNQCNDKWDNLLRDYKKVREYEVRLSPGQSSYWQLEKHERKDKMLPSNFAFEVSEALRDVVDKKYPPHNAASSRLIHSSSASPPPVSQSQQQQQQQQCQLLVSPPPLLAHDPHPHQQFQFTPQQLRTPTSQYCHVHAPVPPLPPQATLQEPPSGESNEIMESSESESGSTPRSPAKRRKVYKGSSSSGRGLGPAMSKSTFELSQTLLACEKKKDKRHKDLLDVQERKLHIEEKRTEISRQGVEGLIDAVNNLANAILTLASDKSTSLTD